MTRNCFLIAIFLIFISLFFINDLSYAGSWNDLHEEKENLFGSEKELKYNPDMFFLQRESWEDHYSFMLLWLFKYTDYPKYSSTRLIPFYYGLESKIDNRKLSFIPAALTYWETDGYEKFKINPLFVSSNYKAANEDKSGYSYSLLHGYSFEKNRNSELSSIKWWTPIIPLVYRNTGSSGGHMNIGWLIDYTWDREKNGDEHLTKFWFIPLLFHQPGDDGYTNILPPVFIYNRHSSGEYRLNFFPFFTRSKDIYNTYSPDPEKKYLYEDTFISLLFCFDNISTGKWGVKEKSSEFWAPVIPLVYSYNEPGVESHRNVIGLIDWHNDANGKTDRFWFMPFLFHRPGDDGYTNILPPVFIYNRHISGEYWLNLIPFFLRSKDKYNSYSPDPKKKYEYEDTFFSPFLCFDNIYKDNWGGEAKSTQFWAPIIPLVYSYNEPGVESHRNVIGLIDWHNDANGKTDRFWFMPFLFHRPGDNGYTNILPPIYIYNRHNSGEYWLSLIPFFLRSKDKYVSYSQDLKKKYEYEDTFFSHFLCFDNIYKDNWGGEEKSTQFWAPIIPLVYSYNEPGVESHRSVIGLIDWHNDANGKTDRFWFMPFYFAGRDSYRHILPPLYISFYSSENDSYSHLLPLYMNIRSTSTAYSADSKKMLPVSERYLFTPLSGYTSVKSPDAKGDVNSQSYWFPIIPLYYHSEWNKGTHTNLLWAFDWKRNSSGDLERFWFIPLVFHKPGEGGYRFYFPFYFRPTGWSKKDGVAYSPVYYHRWTEDTDTKWTWLIHYKESRFNTGEYLNTWMPFYYHHNVPGKGETTWALPFYYGHDSLKSGGYAATIFAPLYWNFETKKRDTTLFLPLYFETKKKNGRGSFYLNIAGISESILAGTSPVADAGLGFNKKGMYIDMDVSWIYDLWSVSTRITIPMKTGQEFADEESLPDAPTGDVTLTKTIGPNRDSSINFWGFHLLYGLVAFEKADTKKHFRLLPLSYLSWDDTSGEKIKWILNYMSYKEKDTEYLVFFPFYGYQRIGESYSTGYLLNAFWHEYNDENKMNEYTLLWPVF